MGFHQSDSKIALVYEYLEEGSLYHHLHDVCATHSAYVHRPLALLLHNIIFLVICGSFIMG